MINKIFNGEFNVFNSRRGFTILETIVAIAVVSLAIAGAASAVRIGIIGSSSAKDQAKAFYLAQEAIEVIRNMRDRNTLAAFNGGSTHWLAGIAAGANDPCAHELACTVDASSYLLSRCTGLGGACPPLRQNGSAGSAAYMYGYNSTWTATPFTREVRIENVSADEIRVVVRVTWTRGLTAKSFQTETILKNWF